MTQREASVKGIPMQIRVMMVKSRRLWPWTMIRMMIKRIFKKKIDN